MDISNQVREANKILYDKLATNYEMVDGRRSQDLYLWIRERLKEISQIAGERNSLLDIGCGSGFVARAAKGIFPKLYGIDISENILKGLFSYGISPIRADARKLPFKDASMDVVALFSVVHHFYDYRPVLNEVYRILKPRGIVYIDHDMNKYFFKNFHFFINLYRRISPKERFFKRIGLEKLYNLSEFHSTGIDSERLRDYLISLRFSITKSYYHWYGISGWTNFMFGKRRFSREVAPLTVFIAQKGNS